MRELTPLEESLASRAALVKRYGGRWPAFRRRYRVEDSQAGSSRLLMQGKAAETQTRYGGTVVEVIPLVPLGKRQADNMPKCRYCGAEARQPCTSKTGKERLPHAARWEDLHHNTPAPAVIDLATVKAS